MTVPSKRYEWHETYRRAVLETDPAQVVSRIGVAKSAIVARKKELSGNAGSHTDELQTIEKALKILELLAHDAREERDFSD